MSPDHPPGWFGFAMGLVLGGIIGWNFARLLARKAWKDKGEILSTMQDRSIELMGLIDKVKRVTE